MSEVIWQQQPWGTATGSVRAGEPGRFPAAETPTGDPVELGIGTRYPETNEFKGCEPHHLRRRALQLQPVRQILELAACVLMVMGKGPRAWVVLVHRHWIAKHTGWKVRLAGYQEGGRGKAVARKGRRCRCVNAVMTTMWALSPRPNF
jgi:hypothetical protein